MMILSMPCDTEDLGLPDDYCFTDHDADQSSKRRKLDTSLDLVDSGCSVSSSLPGERDVSLVCDSSPQSSSLSLHQPSPKSNGYPTTPSTYYNHHPPQPPNTPPYQAGSLCPVGSVSWGTSGVYPLPSTSTGGSSPDRTSQSNQDYHQHSPHGTTTAPFAVNAMLAPPTPAEHPGGTPTDNNCFSTATDFHSSAKGLLQSGSTAFTSPYYNGNVYNGQTLTGFYGVDSASHYSAFTQSYGIRSLKASPSPYTLSPYFGTNGASQTQLSSYYASPYGSVGSGQNLDYMYYPQHYSSYYAAAGCPVPMATANPVQAATTSPASSYHHLPPPSTVLPAGNNANDSQSQGSGGKDLSPVVKTEGKKSKGKKRKRDVSPSPESEWERVFIWDLDETLLIFNSLFEGIFAQKFGKNPHACSNLGMEMKNLICSVGNSHFFFQDLQECDQVHIEDLATDDNGQDLGYVPPAYNFATDGFLNPLGPGGLCLPPPSHTIRGGMDWMRKLAYRYRRIRDLYNQFRDEKQNDLRGLLSARDPDVYLMRHELDALTDSWRTLALKCATLITSRPRCANVLVTNSQLAPSLVKLLLYGLAPAFPVENIYSSAKLGKEACFDRVVGRFGKKCTYVVVGDGREEESAALQLQIPFWRVTAPSDLIALEHALDLGHL